MRILILGSNGMLGHMVKMYLEQYYEIEIINHRWPMRSFKTAILNSKADFLINCIGAIPQRTNDFTVNFELPIWLDNNFGGHIIHPGTDCEMDLDDYGISKRKASDWIFNNGNKTKIIKTSIIGPELSGSSSFLNWFLSNTDGSIVNGYINHLWNGISTFYWAKFSKRLIESWIEYPIRIVLSSECISKYQMCIILNKVYNRNIIIKKFKTEKPVNKCLDSDIKLANIEIQLREMIEFYKKQKMNFN